MSNPVQDWRHSHCARRCPGFTCELNSRGPQTQGSVVVVSYFRWLLTIGCDTLATAVPHGERGNWAGVPGHRRWLLLEFEDRIPTAICGFFTLFPLPLLLLCVTFSLCAPLPANPLSGAATPRNRKVARSAAVMGPTVGCFFNNTPRIARF